MGQDLTERSPGCRRAGPRTDYRAPPFPAASKIILSSLHSATRLRTENQHNRDCSFRYGNVKPSRGSKRFGMPLGVVRHQHLHLASSWRSWRTNPPEADAVGANGAAVGTGGSKGIPDPVEVAETKGLSLSQD